MNWIDWPSCDDPLAEDAFRNAIEAGIKATECLKTVTWLARSGAVSSDFSEALVEAAIRNTREAASWYHEAIQLTGECPDCGDRLPVSDYVREGESQFQECCSCHEPEPREFEAALASVYAEPDRAWEQR